jgi:hypothetical protein
MNTHFCPNCAKAFEQSECVHRKALLVGTRLLFPRCEVRVGFSGGSIIVIALLWWLLWGLVPCTEGPLIGLYGGIGIAAFGVFRLFRQWRAWRQSRKENANQPAEGNARVAPPLTIEGHRPGVPEPDQSAMSGPSMFLLSSCCQNVEGIATSMAWSMIAVILTPLLKGWAGVLWFAAHLRSIGPWPVVAWMLPLAMLGVALGGGLARIIRRPPPALLLVPSVVVLLVYAPTASRNYGTSSEGPFLFFALWFPLLACVPFYLSLSRRLARRSEAGPPVVGPTTVMQTGLLRRFLIWIGVGINLAGVLLGYTGIENLKGKAWQPFDDGHTMFVDVLYISYPPPLWVPAFWDSIGGHVIVWLITILLAAHAATGCRGPVPVRYLGPAFALALGVTGLSGLWIWTHSIVNVGGPPW